MLISVPVLDVGIVSDHSSDTTCNQCIAIKLAYSKSLNIVLLRRIRMVIELIELRRTWP